VEDKKNIVKEELVEKKEEDEEMEQFARHFHQLSPSHR